MGWRVLFPIDRAGKELNFLFPMPAIFLLLSNHAAPLINIISILRIESGLVRCQNDPRRGFLGHDKSLTTASYREGIEGFCVNRTVWRLCLAVFYFTELILIEAR